MTNAEGEKKAGFSEGQLDTLSKMWDLQVGHPRMLIAVAGSELVDSCPHKDDLLVSYGGVTTGRIKEFNEVQEAFGTGAHIDENGNLYATVQIFPDSELEEGATEQAANTELPESSPEQK